jgi:hypothetical protein
VYEGLNEAAGLVINKYSIYEDSGVPVHLCFIYGYHIQVVLFIFLYRKNNFLQEKAVEATKQK